MRAPYHRLIIKYKALQSNQCPFCIYSTIKYNPSLATKFISLGCNDVNNFPKRGKH